MSGGTSGFFTLVEFDVFLLGKSKDGKPEVRVASLEVSQKQEQTQQNSSHVKFWYTFDSQREVRILRQQSGDHLAFRVNTTTFEKICPPLSLHRDISSFSIHQIDPEHLERNHQRQEHAGGPEQREAREPDEQVRARSAAERERMLPRSRAAPRTPAQATTASRGPPKTGAPALPVSRAARSMAPGSLICPPRLGGTAEPNRPAAVAYGSIGDPGTDHHMNRNILYLALGALIVGAGVLGYQLYQERQKPGISISIGGKEGLKIEGKGN